MPRLAFKMFLNPGQHDPIWPELAALLKQAGVANYSIHLDEQTNILFAYLERPRRHGMDDLPSHPIMQRWWAHMRDIMAVNPDGSPVAAALEEMFHLE
ncbi:MAG TPA: L-rhamnose mutarotase [Roseiarcus sp.]|nr:L-rhamnose mutarotase [Roseiarcus sp.]